MAFLVLIPVDGFAASTDLVIIWFSCNASYCLMNLYHLSNSSIVSTTTASSLRSSSVSDSHLLQFRQNGLIFSPSDRKTICPEQQHGQRVRSSTCSRSYPEFWNCVLHLPHLVCRLRSAQYAFQQALSLTFSPINSLSSLSPQYLKDKTQSSKKRDWVSCSLMLISYQSVILSVCLLFSEQNFMFISVIGEICGFLLFWLPRRQASGHLAPKSPTWRLCCSRLSVGDIHPALLSIALHQSLPFIDRNQKTAFRRSC